MGDLFLKLLNMSLTAGWLVLVVLVVRVLFQRMPKWIRCVLWGMVAIRLLVPFSIESVFSLQPSAEPIRTASVVEGEILPYVPSVDSDLSFVKNRVNPALRNTFAYKAEESAAPLQIVTAVAGNIWLAGGIVLILFAMVSTFRLYALVKEAIRYKDHVYLCDAVTTPFILGVIRPRIYLPSSLSEEELDYILAHERAHLQRGDHFWKPVGYLLLCVYWFNPLLILAYILLCKDIELACDEKVIRDMSLSEKKEYSRVLLSCATQRKFVLTCPLAFGEVGVRDRIKTVLNHKKAAAWITILAVLVCVIIAACFLTDPETSAIDQNHDITAQPDITVPEENSASGQAADSSIYGKIVADLGDTEAYALLHMEYEHYVLLTSDMIYDGGEEKQAAMGCDVYYAAEHGASLIGTILSDGTAYPISFTRDGIFAASGHKVEKYAVSQEGDLFLQKGIYEQFDENGNPSYTKVINGQQEASTEQEYLELAGEYSESQIVHFSYGAKDSVNDIVSDSANSSVADSAKELPGVSMQMEKYKSWEGVVEITNDPGRPNNEPEHRLAVHIWGTSGRNLSYDQSCV